MEILEILVKEFNLKLKNVQNAVELLDEGNE